MEIAAQLALPIPEVRLCRERLFTVRPITIVHPGVLISEDEYARSLSAPRDYRAADQRHLPQPNPRSLVMAFLVRRRFFHDQPARGPLASCGRSAAPSR